MRKLTRGTGAISLLVLFVLLAYWKVILTHQYTFFVGVDTAGQYYPWYQFAGWSWKSGSVPLWDPFIGSGRLFFEEMQPGAFFPLNVLLFLMPSQNGGVDLKSMDLLIVFYVLIAAIGQYLLLRFMQISRPSSVIGACIFALGGYTSFVAGHLSILGGIICLPWIVLVFLRALESTGTARIRLVLGGGFLLGLSLLAGHIQPPVHICLILLFFTIAAVCRKQQTRFRISTAGVLIGTVIISIAVAAVQLIPSFLYSLDAYRWVYGAKLDPVQRIPFELQELWSPSEYLSLIVPSTTSHGFYFSIGALFLALFAVLVSRNKYRRLFALGALLCFVYSWGRASSLFSALYLFMPFVEKVPESSRSIFMLQFFVAGLAAIGADTLLSPLPARCRRKFEITSNAALTIICITLAVVMAAAFWHVSQKGAIRTDSFVPYGVSASLLAMSGGLIFLRKYRMIRLKSLKVALVLLIAFDLTSFIITYTPQRSGESADRLYAETSTTAFLRGLPGNFRVVDLAGSLPYNFGDAFRIQTTGGHSASSRKKYFDFLNSNQHSTMQMLNARYYVSKKDAGPMRRIHKDEKTGVSIYEDPEALPRTAFAAADGALDPSKIGEHLLRRRRLDGESRIVSYKPNEIIVACKAANAGYLWMSELADPDWKATVDGLETPILISDAVFRAIPVPAGEHSVRLVYRPVAVYAGAAISILTCLLVLLCNIHTSIWRFTMRAKAWIGIFFSFAFFLFTCNAFALGQTQYIESVYSTGGFPIVQGAQAATICVDSKDWPGVILAVNSLQSDISLVTGVKAPVSNNPGGMGKHAIIVGTIGKSQTIDGLIKAGKIDASQIAGKWESFILQVVPNPLPGVATGLAIVGSDKRGTIYGVYDLSEQIGVSPWHWWADVPVRRNNNLFVKAGKYCQGEPSVKYRGIFLNDEAPDLTEWVREKFGNVPERENPPIPPGVANYNSKFYAKLFELILRLKGNYLWPAMWNNAFNEDDMDNPRLADEYGVVMGTSHQEPMLRAQKEWDRRYQKTLGSWNYYKNPDILRDFWREGVRRNKNYESIVTIGLRGANDTPMIPGGTAAQSMSLLEEIVAAQRKMIAEEINPDVAKVPQLWCLYKEVQEYYEKGLRVPEDVTLLWADDNWGNIRRLPTEAERKRPGGAGVYYHFDYVGGPRNYKWINTNPLPKIWEQLTLAKEYGADRIWIVNVGHLKGLEIPIEYFMHLAWNSKRWTNNNIGEYTRLWAAREFGGQYSQEIANIVSRYAKYNGRRKPELLDPSTYSLIHYQELDFVMLDYKLITDEAEALYNKLPADMRDAFYQLVLFPAKACAQVNNLYITAGLNLLYAQQGRSETNDLADRVEALFKADADLMDYFNHTFAGGKWNHFMDQVHIGYTSWQDPPKNVMPRIARLQLPEAAALGVAVAGNASAWPGAPGDPALPRFDPHIMEAKYIDVFNRGMASFEYTAIPSVPWITLSEGKGTIAKEERLFVIVDWSKAPKGLVSGNIKISQKGGASVTVKVESFNPASKPRKRFNGFIEGNGYVSMNAESYTKNVPAGHVRWEKIEDYGKTLSAMAVMPVTARSVTPPQNSPHLEYEMFLYGAGNISVQSTVAPTLNFAPGRGLRYAVSFDNQPPQTVEIVPQNFNAQNGNKEWEESVKNACRIVRSSHTLVKPGYHTLKIWMVDPAVVLQKIVVDLGGVKPSYLGPPENGTIRN